MLIGGVRCTAGCVFCVSAEKVWRPEKVPWACGERNVGKIGGWLNTRALAHPLQAVEMAQEWHCSQIVFGVNEPLATWEYTYDVARVAKRSGLDVLVETNGLATVAAVEKLAPFVDAVYVGIKGSGDPAFYDRWMRAPGGWPTVQAVVRAWHSAGVHLSFGDVIAPPQMQADTDRQAAQERLYRWIHDEIGALTPCALQPMVSPRDQSMFLLSSTASELAYGRCVLHSLALARSVGLAYAYTRTDDTVLRCHACGGMLLRFQSPMKSCLPCEMYGYFCRHWRHEQHVTDGRCDHCGASVPIVAMSEVELNTAWHVADVEA